MHVNLNSRSENQPPSDVENQNQNNNPHGHVRAGSNEEDYQQNLNKQLNTHEEDLAMANKDRTPIMEMMDFDSIQLKNVSEEEKKVVEEFNTINNTKAEEENNNEKQKEIKDYELGLEPASNFDEASEYLAWSCNNLGIAYEGNENYGEATQYYEIALSIYLDLFGDEHEYVAGAYCNIGYSLIKLANQIITPTTRESGVISKKKRLKKALQLFKKAHQVYVPLFGESHETSIAVKNEVERLTDEIKRT